MATVTITEILDDLRAKDLQRLSEERVRRLREQARSGTIRIVLPEPVIEVVPS